jgi:hypothetical protein
VNGGCLKAVIYPSEEAPGSVLCERIALFMRSDRYVRMGYYRGRDEDGCARRKLYDKFEVGEDEVATVQRVVVSEGGNGTVAEGEVSEVEVWDAYGMRPQIVGSSREKAVEGPFEGTVVVKQLTQVIVVIVGKLGSNGM